MFVEELSDYLNEYMRDRDLSQAEMARRAGVHPTVIHRMMRGHLGHLWTIGQVAHALGLVVTLEESGG